MSCDIILLSKSVCKVGRNFSGRRVKMTLNRNNRERNKMKESKEFYKNWKFYAIVFAVLFVGSAVINGVTGNDKDRQGTSSSVNSSKEEAVLASYTITGQTTGEYGKEVTLNANSDTPASKYLYKLPSGKYKVTTTYEKMASFFIVKDQIKIDSNNKDYPETLDYVEGKSYLLTAGKDDFNGKAKKEVEVTIGKDESVQIVNSPQLTFKKITEL